MNKEPLLPDFPSTIFATSKRRLQAFLREARDRVLGRSISGYATMFESILPADFLLRVDPTKRRRSFCHLAVFWAWLAQIFEQNASCNKAVGLIQSWYKASGLPVPGSGTGGYCQARIRFRESFMEEVSKRINQGLKARIREEDRWRGLTLKAIDGSSVQLMDTEENQRVYPQPSGQKPGCGFPVMGIVGVVNLSHGGWEGFETCGWQKHDARVAPRLLPHLESGDLLLADRAYCSFEFAQRLQGKGVHFVMRLHQARHRTLDWRKGKKLSPTERLHVWPKPRCQPTASDLSPEAWAALPEEMTVRYIKKTIKDRSGKKKTLVVVTDLLESNTHPPDEVIDLYFRRWEIELKLRDVKTTLKMEFFAVKTPAMAHKTLAMMVIAYNLLRVLMQEAAHEAERPIYETSLKGTLDLVTSIHESFRPVAHQPVNRRKLYREMIEICATKLIDSRPERHEPRAVKRRPKSYQLLTEHRRKFREIPHRETYRKVA